MIDTIIFDAEGVVIDSEAIWDKGQDEFLRRRGIVYRREVVKHLLTGRSLVDGVRVMQKLYGFAGDPEKLARERKEIVKSFFKNEVVFINGFESFYGKIQEKYRTCVATSLDPELLAIIDGQLNLSYLFRGNLFSIAEVGYRAKPHPDLFLYAADKLNTPVTNCLVIEDAPHGIEAAKRAGMRCVALTTTYDRARLGQADVVVDAYEQIDLRLF